MQRITVRYLILKAILGDCMNSVRAQLLAFWEMDALIFLATDLVPTTKLAELRGVRRKSRGTLRQLLVQESQQWKDRLAEVDLLQFSNLEEVCKKYPKWQACWNADGPLYKQGRGSAAGAMAAALGRGPGLGVLAPPLPVSPQKLQAAFALQQSLANQRSSSELALAVRTQELQSNEHAEAEARSSAEERLEAALALSRPARPAAAAVSRAEQLQRLQQELVRSRAQVQQAELLEEAVARAKHAEAQQHAESEARQRSLDAKEVEEKAQLQALEQEVQAQNALLREIKQKHEHGSAAAAGRPAEESEEQRAEINRGLAESRMHTEEEAAAVLDAAVLDALWENLKPPLPLNENHRDSNLSLSHEQERARAADAREEEELRHVQEQLVLERALLARMPAELRQAMM